MPPILAQKYRDVEKIDVPDDAIWAATKEVIHVVFDSDKYGYHCTTCHSVLSDNVRVCMLHSDVM